MKDSYLILDEYVSNFILFFSTLVFGNSLLYILIILAFANGDLLYILNVRQTYITSSYVT